MSKRRAIEGEKEVDLAALVDIFSNMLFFLLATVSFLQLKTLNAAVPIASSAAVSTGKGVDVALAITDKGYVVDAHGTGVTGEKVDIHQELPRLNGALEPLKLTEVLATVRKVTPLDNKAIIIQAESLIPFQEIVLSMDASRDMPSKINPKTKVPLFTRPVLSRAVTDADLQVPDAPGAPPAPVP